MVPFIHNNISFISLLIIDHMHFLILLKPNRFAVLVLITSWPSFLQQILKIIKN